MTKQCRNHNIRFSMGDETAVQAWERLHSAEVEKDFKSKNAFVVAAINDYYERHLAEQNDPYLESREKEDAFTDRIVEAVEKKVLANIPALIGNVVMASGMNLTVGAFERTSTGTQVAEVPQKIGKKAEKNLLPEEPEDLEKIQYTYHLNGVQATSYCRIRYTASLDMGRTERQRKVIQMIVDKAKSAGLSTIFKIMDDVFPMVTTSMDKTEILQMLPPLIGYSVNDTTGFPSSVKFSNVKGSVIVPTSLESNVIELHKFLYDDPNYTPSATVLANSQRILEIVGGEASLDDTQKVTEENSANDTVIYENNGTTWENTAGSDDSGSTDNDYTGGDTTGGDTTGGDTSGGDDYTGGDTTGGDTSGGDDYNGGDTTGGDTSGGDDYGGGDTTGGDTSGGDDGGDYGGGDDGGDYSEPDYGGDGGGEDIATESVEAA